MPSDDDGALISAPENKYRSEFARSCVSEGEARGEARGLANAIIQILEDRNIDVSPDERSRILACSCKETLTSWVGHAVTADVADRLFD
ncbi:hypothetical protein [Streptomonospora litoralis]|uniref:Uncharacterized protein n=1 Tax=Streptomonospora litoralis TaxID=2498135 RepID=A0A4P6PYP4_9ACTN|nr:hypothetical protein [Streptomonospora litoralis]QBI53285.1 hypothetical protein EKD16_07445 [Streptomonospora litoralis]